MVLCLLVLIKPKDVKANEILGKVQIDGVHDYVLTHGLPKDRFRLLPYERFR